jgi:hypothetical protein
VVNFVWRRNGLNTGGESKCVADEVAVLDGNIT